MFHELKKLRDDCASVLQRLDAILPLIEDISAPKCGAYKFEISGICHSFSTHAMTRYRERTGSKHSDEKILNAMRARMANADEWVLKEKFRLIELLAHGTPARYFKCNEMMVVIENETVVTVHFGTATRWVRKDLQVSAK